MTAPPPNATHPQTIAEWRSWLEGNHTRKQGVWLIRYKKATGKPYVDENDAIEEALCFGWIDSKPSKLDEERTMLWFAPRQPGSGWSKLNKERIERMIAADRMTPAGWAKIEAAQQDGSWSALDAIDALEIPPDLVAMFGNYAGSQGHFNAFPRSVKRGILEWISTAKRPQTRAKRIEETARLAAENLRANQWPR